MRCLITGVAGFIGSTLAEKLLSLGHTVIGIDCFTDYYSPKLKINNLKKLKENTNFTFQEGDLVNLDLVSLLSGVDWVFHQAAQAGVRASWGKTFLSYTHHNIDASQALLEAAKATPSIKKFVYASSSSIYGDAESFPTREEVAPRPVSPYGVTKLAAENLMYLYSREFGVPTVSLRYFTVYGPRQRPDMAFNRFLRKALRKQPLTLYGDGKQSRDFTFINDIVDGNILAAEKGVSGRAYNLGGGSQVTMLEVIEMIREIVGEITIKQFPRQEGDAAHTSADTALARSDLGFKPAFTVKEGLKLEAAWMDEILRTPLGAELGE